MRLRPDSPGIEVIRILLDGHIHTAPELIESTRIGMTTVYGALSRMTVDGWVERGAIPGMSRRVYRATEHGLRAMRYVVAVADQSADDDSRSSSPTAARSSS